MSTQLAIGLLILLIVGTGIGLYGRFRNKKRSRINVSIYRLTQQLKQQ